MPDGADRASFGSKHTRNERVIDTRGVTRRIAGTPDKRTCDVEWLLIFGWVIVMMLGWALCIVLAVVLVKPLRRVLPFGGAVLTGALAGALCLGAFDFIAREGSPYGTNAIKRHSRSRSLRQTPLYTPAEPANPLVLGFLMGFGALFGGGAVFLLGRPQKNTPTVQE